MCVASMVGDHYRDKWQEKPWFNHPGAIGWPQPAPVSQQEFADLKREVLEMKELLKRAIKYDEDNGEPECEIDEKMDLLRRVAALVGVELNDVIKPKESTHAQG